jgi:four helix bundle protein
MISVELGDSMSGIRDLKAWQRSFDLVLEIYRKTQSFPKEEIYGLTSQMRRAAVSVCSNIAEGKGRSSDKEFIVFLCHARGSLLELETQVSISKELGYLRQDTESKMEDLTAEVGRIVNGLINSLRKSSNRNTA